jgi:hypothetical protein
MAKPEKAFIINMKRLLHWDDPIVAGGGGGFAGGTRTVDPFSWMLLVVVIVPIVTHAVTAPPNSAPLRAADGRIVDPQDCGYLKAAFKPSVEDVRRLERLLPAALAALAAKQSDNDGGAKGVLQHLATDHRYYVGVARGVIVVCANSFFRNEPLGRCPPMINDGGDGVWYIEFDPKTGEFSKFGTNGLA